MDELLYNNMGLLSHSQNSDPQFLLSERNAGTEMKKSLRVRRANDRLRFGPSIREAPWPDTITDAMMYLPVHLEKWIKSHGF